MVFCDAMCTYSRENKETGKTCHILMLKQLLLNKNMCLKRMHMACMNQI
jgi:hypothetical protein